MPDEVVDLPGKNYISRLRIEAFENMTIKDLRAWILHLHYLHFRSDAIRDAIYVIYLKRKRLGHKNTPERSWLKERGYV